MQLTSLDKGIHRSPSAPSEGQLDISVNLMAENGEIRNAPRPQHTGVTLPANAKLLAVHHVEGQTNYIYALPETRKVITVTPGDTYTWSISPSLSEGQSVTIAVTGTYKTVTIINRKHVVKIISFETETTITTDTVLNVLNIPIGRNIQDLSITDISVKSTTGGVSAYVVIASGTSSSSNHIRPRINTSNEQIYNALYYKTASGEGILIKILNGGITSVVPMGNTLIIQSGAICYALWREGSYVWLGSEFPNIDIQFRLKGEYVSKYKLKPGATVTSDSANPKNFSFSDVVQSDVLTRDGYDRIIINLDSPLDTEKIYKLIIRGYNVKKANAYYGLQTPQRKYSDDVIIGSLQKTDNYHHEILFTPKSTASVITIFLYGKNNTVNTVLLSGGESYNAVFKPIDGDSGETGFNTIIGIANEFVNDQIRDNDKFIYPFLIRYAVRLFDGSFVNLSAPCLLVPNNDTTPFVHSVIPTISVEPAFTYDADVFCDAIACDIQYKILNIEDFSDWKDIITDIVVAVTPQAYTYDQGAKFDPTDVAVKIHIIKAPQQQGTAERTWTDTLHHTGFCYGSIQGESGEFNFSYLAQDMHSNLDGLQYELPGFDANHIKKEITDRGDFHIIKHIKIEDIIDDGSSSDDSSGDDDGFTTLELEKGTLTGLESRSTIDESSGNISSITASAIKVYNQRLMLGNVVQKMSNGALPSMMNGICGDYEDGTQAGSYLRLYAVVTQIRTGTEMQTAVRIEPLESQIVPINSNSMFWLFYPSESATEMTIYAQLIDEGSDSGSEDDTSAWRQATVQLTQHKSLSGAYFFDNFNAINWEDCPEGFDPSQAFVSDTFHTVRASGKVLQSKVADPFVFPTSLQSYVTKGEVQALATATTALSEGQFGQFPVYAFCSDGIWSLSFNSSGQLTADQAVARETTNNIGSIIETDSLIIFATRQGLKLLNGSNVQEIAGHMEGLPATSKYGSSEYAENILTGFGVLKIDDERTWEQIISTARFAFDYPNNLLHIYPQPQTSHQDACPWHFIMSLDDAHTGMVNQPCPRSIVRDMTTDIVTYDETADNTTTCYVCEYTDTDDFSAKHKGFLLTRPVSFDDPLAMKVINDLRVIKHLPKANAATDPETVRVAILASNDRLTWHRVTSLRHHSFKWFRFALFTDMTDAARIDGIYAETDTRRVTKPR